MVRLPRNEKHTYRLTSRPQMWPSGLTLAMTLTLDYQGQIWNWLYLCEKWSDCHETKSEHINWTLGLKCDHQIWPWPWPWPWILKFKYEICYISTKSSPIATKWKANKSIWTLGLKYDNEFDLGHDLDIWIFKVICDLDHLVTKVKCQLHSTETALLRVQNDLLRAVDTHGGAILVLLDLSAAFDTIDHHRLESSFGIQGKALDWFHSYLTGRTQTVHIKWSSLCTLLFSDIGVDEIEFVETQRRQNWNVGDNISTKHEPVHLCQSWRSVYQLKWWTT